MVATGASRPPCPGLWEGTPNLDVAQDTAGDSGTSPSSLRLCLHLASRQQVPPDPLPGLSVCHPPGPWVSWHFLEVVGRGSQGGHQPPQSSSPLQPEGLHPVPLFHGAPLLPSLPARHTSLPAPALHPGLCRLPLRAGWASVTAVTPASLSPERACSGGRREPHGGRCVTL